MAIAARIQTAPMAIDPATGHEFVSEGPDVN
jgi:hypothetical protein